MAGLELPKMPQTTPGTNATSAPTAPAKSEGAGKKDSTAKTDKAQQKQAQHHKAMPKKMNAPNLGMNLGGAEGAAAPASSAGGSQNIGAMLANNSGGSGSGGGNVQAGGGENGYKQGFADGMKKAGKFDAMA